MNLLFRWLLSFLIRIIMDKGQEIIKSVSGDAYMTEETQRD